MPEAAVNKQCAQALRAHFVQGVYYKHCDKMSSGRPDSTFTWNGVTSWLEFKLLEGGENVHAKNAKDTHGLAKDQLVELIRLENAGAPAWVVAYRKPTRLIVAHLTIYRPTALLTVGGTVMPVQREWSTHINVLRDLKLYGVAAFQGFDHKAVVALVNLSHGTY